MYGNGRITQDAEVEYPFSAYNPLERIIYEAYVRANQRQPIQEKAQSKAKPRKKASRTGNSARPRTRVRKQVLQRTSEEAPNGYFDWEALSRLRKKGKY